MGDRLGGGMDADRTGKANSRKTRRNLIGAFSVNGLGVSGVSATVSARVHRVFARRVMVRSVTAVLSNRFVGRFHTGDQLKTSLAIATEDR